MVHDTKENNQINKILNEDIFVDYVKIPSVHRPSGFSALTTLKLAYFLIIQMFSSLD